MPRLPPVDISPQTRLRARFCPGVICSAFTLFQSHSSSSATSWTSPVIVPCPISERATRTTQVSSGLTKTHALTSAPSVVLCATAGPKPDGKLNPSASPPPAAAEPTMNVRRESFAALPRIVVFTAGLPKFWMCRWPPCARQLGCADLFRLAIAALRHVDRRPGLLHGMRPAGGEPFDGDDPVGRFHVSDADGAGALHLVIDVKGAGAALRNLAAVFAAGESDLFAG